MKPKKFVLGYAQRFYGKKTDTLLIIDEKDSK